MKFKSILFLFVLFSIISCSSKVNSPSSVKWKKFKAPHTFKYIPSGTLLLDEKTKVSINGFFMQETEVSNLEYREFLNDLNLNEKKEKYEIAKQHPEKWNQERGFSFGEPYVTTYHNHPSYDDYPVVTISHEGAKLYCEWLTNFYNNKYPDKEFTFRLPTEEEWMYAAYGGHEYAPFPWDGYYYRNANGKILANFKRVSGLNIKFNTETNQYETIGIERYNSQNSPAPAKSYLPNDYGLFNMSGNAAEMLNTSGKTKGGSYNSTAYHIQIQGADEYKGWSEPSAFIGFRPVMVFKEKTW